MLVVELGSNCYGDYSGGDILILGEWFEGLLL